MKNSIFFYILSVFFCFSWVGQAFAVNENTDCDKEAEYSHPCGVEWRGIHSRTKYCTAINYAKRAACLTEKEAIKQRKRFQKEVRKAEKVLDDSKRAYRKVQKYAEKYKSVKIPKFPSDALKNADPSRFVSGTYDAWKGYLSALEKAGIPAGELNKMFGGKYTSNKRDKMRVVEKGGWIVAWGREINERDAGDGVVAAGVSIFSGGSSAYMWAQRLVIESIEKMGRSMRDAGNRLGDQAQDRLTKVAKKVISDALKAKMPKSDSLNFGNLQAKAGLVKYSGTNSFKLPGGNRTTVSKTWGFIPYVAVRIMTESHRNLKCREIGTATGELSADIYCSLAEVVGFEPEFAGLQTPPNVECPKEHISACENAFKRITRNKCPKYIKGSNYKKYMQGVCVAR